MRVIDVHNHIGISRDTAIGKSDELLSIMRDAGIDQSVIFPIDPEDSGATYEVPNDQIITCVNENSDKFIGFCRLQPKAGSKAVEEMKRCFDQGLKGVKLHPRSEHFYLEDCYALFKAIGEARCPVMLHTEHHTTRRPSYWRGVFEKYEQVDFILAHAGKDFFKEACEMARELSNVHLDTSTMSYNRTRMVYEMVGADKIVFASDYPYSHPLLEKKKYEILVNNQSDLEKIFYLNAKRILKLD